MEIITRTLDKEVVQKIAATIFMALHHHGVEPDNCHLVNVEVRGDYRFFTFDRKEE